LKSAINVSLGKQFPQDDCFWRVDWVGSATSNHAEKEPKISVFLTKIKECFDSKIHPLDPKSTYKSSSGFSERIEVPIGVGHQSLVSIGSVWQKGVNVSHAYAYTKFPLTLDTSKAVPIVFQHTNEQGKRVLTPYQYPVGDSAYKKIKSSTLIAIPYNGDDCGFLIPASEIIRFYYLISTRMSMALYQGGFDKLVIEKDTLFLPMARHVEFTLNWGVSIFDVPIIARYLSSEVMQERVDEIFRWIRANSINLTQYKATTTFFPFDEKTNLTFEGILVRGDDNKQRILCTRLITCSGPFNYDLAIASKRISDASEEDSETEKTNLPWWNIAAFEPLEEIDLDEEPSKKHLTKHFVSLECRFENLINKSINIGKVNYQSNRKRKIRYETSKEKRKISTSNGTFGKSNTGKANFGLNLDSGSSIPPRLQTFIDVLKLLRTEGYLVKTIHVSLPKEYEGKQGSQPVATSTIADEIVVGCFKTSKVKNDWVNIDIGGSLKPRGMMIAQVSFNTSSIYLFELEQSLNNEKKENFSVLIQYMDFTRFNRHIIMSKLERRVNNERHQIYSRI